MIVGLLGSLLAGISFFAALPATSTYQLNSFGFGSGGGVNSTTSTYTLEGISGELSGQTSSTATYSIKPGFIETQQANVPKVTLSNPSNYYDKLKFVIDTQSNPSDALYALQISTTSNFSSDIHYIKLDHTIGTTLVTADYQTYANWGGASGTTIIGLASNTTYYLRAKAAQHNFSQADGRYTETGYGPSSSAATIGQTISFCLYTGINCAAGGNTIDFGSLTPAVQTNSSTVNLDLDTNADAGANIYIYSLNGGLKSTSAGNYLIASATADLSVASEGFGAQTTTNTPLTPVSPYQWSGSAPNNVGIVNSTVRTILTTSSPVTGGTNGVRFQTKPSLTTSAAADYAETITFIAAAIF